MRDFIVLYINGKKHTIKVANTHKNLSSYLRDNLHFTGTKVVCSEGDCGACTVLAYKVNGDFNKFVTINSCIAPLYLLDCSHIITIEGIEEKELHPIQKSFAKHHGTQCGFCTPGFINAFASMCDDVKSENKMITSDTIKKCTVGNLCRCTGYKGIVEAGLELDFDSFETFFTRYHTQTIEEEFQALSKNEVVLKDEKKEVLLPKDLNSALRYKKEGYSLISGGTDISVFINKGYNKEKKFIALNNIEEFYKIKLDQNYIEVGAMVSLSKLSAYCKDIFPIFNDVLDIFASPQIKNKGTLVGNVANGSPIGDTIPLLYVCDAVLEICSSEYKREVLIYDFYLGYKEFDLKDSEIITNIKIPIKKKEYKFYKVSARKDLDISAVSMAVSYELENNIIKNISIAYGGVAATVYKTKELEQELIGKTFSRKSFEDILSIIPNIFIPFSDHRGSSEYRIKLCQNLLLKFVNEVCLEKEVAL
jgi:xanthine dehydrogenase small subunit